MKKTVSIFAVGLLLGAVAVGYFINTLPSREGPRRNYHVVELFTSENCKRCPEAEAIFKDLIKRHDVIGVAYHVDYSQPPMKPDPYALPDALALQEAYAAASGDEMLFTPQFAIDGVPMPAGSLARHITPLLDGDDRGAWYALVVMSVRDGTVVLEHLEFFGDGDRTLLILEDGLANNSFYGDQVEKRPHKRVVRHMQSVPAGVNVVEIPLDDEWNTAALRVVVFTREDDRIKMAGESVVEKN